MPVTSVGVDICDIKRMRKIEEKFKARFLQKIFTSKEIAYCEKKHNKHSSYAARFAAKEAFLKAIGTGLRDGFQWKDVEIENDNLGKPYFKFYGQTAKFIAKHDVHLSLSHTEKDAIAFVIIEGEPFLS
jgi:holo-[acyl-carrier protein] synthase